MNYLNDNAKRSYVSENPLKNVFKGIIVILLFTFTLCAMAQVGVGNTDPQATLDITSSNTTNPNNNDGILIPRVSNFPASNPTASQDGMLIFYTGTGSSGKGFYYWEEGSVSWIFLSGAKRINDLLDGKSDNDGSNDGSSIFLGIDAGTSDDGSNNENIGIGYQALQNNASGNKNVAIGNATLQISSANFNTAIGHNALASNTTGVANLGIGPNSLFNDTTGDFNIALGHESGLSNLTGRYNSYLGNYSGRRNIAGNYNTFVGNISGNSIRGDNNVTIGHAAGGNQAVKNVNGSVFIGYFAGALEFGSNRLYIDNSSANQNNALIYGEFDNNVLRTNSEFQIGNPTTTGYAFPTVDGTNGQVLATDGSGQINFTTLSFTDTQNTLDQAYDEGGPGAGRIITADSGAVTIDGGDTSLEISGALGGSGKTGILATYTSTTNQTITGINQSFNNTANGNFNANYGLRNSFQNVQTTTTGVSNTYGSYNLPPGRLLRGFSNYYSGGNFPFAYGFINTLSPAFTNNGNYIGYGNVIQSPGTGNRTGFEATIAGSGTGNKYGLNVNINSGAGGVHYGVYSVVQKSNSYAGYFLGRLSVGTTTTNNYILPSTRGGNGYVIQSTGGSSTDWVDPDTIGTDNQTIDTFSFNTSTNELTLEIEDDGIPAQTVNLSSLTDDDWTPVGTDIERQSGDVYIGDTSGTDNDLYISNSIIDWDDNSYLINPGSESYVNEINFDAGSNTDPSIHFDADINTGFYRSEANAIGFTGNGIARIQLTSRGQIEFTNTGNSTYIGVNSGENDDFSNNQNVGIGDFTLEDNTLGQANVALGYLSMRRNITGGSNIGLGYGTLFSNTIGDYNVAVGRNALSSNVGGLRNIGIGNQTLSSNVSGNDNVAIGYQTLINTTGDYNIGIGHTAGSNISTGTRNIAIGYRAQAAHTSGNDNIVLGDRAMDTSTNSISNIAIGRNALTNITEGSYNIAIGQMALGQNVGASPNAANNNVAIGHQAGQNVEGDANVYIGYQAGINDGTASNHLYIENSSADSNNALIYGEFDNDILRFNGDVGIGRAPATNALEINGQASKSTAGAFIANSDRRLKTNIKTISGKTALQKLLSLRGVSYEWNDDQTQTIRPDGIQYGFVAQELMEVFPEKVSLDNLGYYQTAYGDYDPFFVQAIKELKEEVDVLATENATLKAKLQKLEALDARLTALENNSGTSQTNNLVSKE